MIMLQSCCRSCQIRTILLKISVPVGFVSTFQIYGRWEVGLATQPQISVACGTQHISVCAEDFLVIFVLTPKFKKLYYAQAHSRVIYGAMNLPLTERKVEIWENAHHFDLFYLHMIWFQKLGHSFHASTMRWYCNMLYFDFSPVGMNPYQTDVVTHRNSGVPVKCILGMFNGIYSEQTGVPQEFVGSSSAWCLRILGRHPAINLLPPHAVETVVGLENMKLSMGEVFVLDLP